jgi:hypothetical protein
MRTGSSRRTTARITTISEALALPQTLLSTPIRVQAGRLRLET